MANKQLEEDYINDAMAIELNDALNKDMRLNVLIRQHRKAVKKGDIKKQSDTLLEMEQRRIQVAEQLISKKASEDEQRRTLAKYMSGEKAETYNEQRDALNILFDALETIFMQMKDLVDESTEFIQMEYPDAFIKAKKCCKEWLKTEFEVLGNESQDRLAEESDKLVDYVMQRVKLQRKLLTERNKLNKITL